MIVGTGGFDPEAALGDSLTRWQARLTALTTGQCAAFMQAQAAIITPPPVYVDPAPYSPTAGWSDAP